MFTETFEAAAEIGRAASRIRLLAYPDEEDRRMQLAAEGRPRLLLLAPGCPPPTLLDDLEDWVRCPIEADELDARLAELERRWVTTPSQTQIGFRDGILRVGERWTTIPTAQWDVVQLLVDRRQWVVGDDEVARAYGSTNRRAIRSMMQRLGKRLEEVGLDVHKVRGRGYLLEMERP